MTYYNPIFQKGEAEIAKLAADSGAIIHVML
jgi:tryptophan synthase alpha subunit